MNSPSLDVAQGQEGQRIKSLPRADEPCDLVEYIGPPARVEGRIVAYRAESRCISRMTIEGRSANQRIVH
jgi:hypothetical protein